MLASVGKKTAGEFFSAVEHALVTPVTVAEAPTAPGVPISYAAPAPTVPAGRSSDLWAMATAFGAGGFVALAGVAVGWTLARRSRRR
jgi:hypothetical protein